MGRQTVWSEEFLGVCTQFKYKSFSNCVLLSKSLGFSNLSFLIYKMEVKINTAPSIIGSQKDEKDKTKSFKILTS